MAKLQLNGGVLRKENWAEFVDFDCGCSALKDDTTGGYFVSNFCEEHDPTVKH